MLTLEALVLQGAAFTSHPHDNSMHASRCVQGPLACSKRLEVLCSSSCSSA